MWTVLYWTRSSRTQFGVSINVWRLAGDSLNITCNFLYCNRQVHGDLLIILYNEGSVHSVADCAMGAIFRLSSFRFFLQRAYLTLNVRRSYSPGDQYVEFIGNASVWVKCPRVPFCETPYTGFNPTSFSLPCCDGRQKMHWIKERVYQQTQRRFVAWIIWTDLSTLNPAPDRALEWKVSKWEGNWTACFGLFWYRRTCYWTAVWAYTGTARHLLESGSQLIITNQIFSLCLSVLLRLTDCNNHLLLLCVKLCV
jgi:hypothetical protein